MDFLTENLYIASSVVQLLAYLALTVMCLARLRRGWAVLGVLAGLTSMLVTGWYFAATMVLRFGDTSTATELFYAPPAQVLMQLVTMFSTVALVAAVLVGRRTPAPPADTSGPTGTTFRQLPSGIRWE